MQKPAVQKISIFLRIDANSIENYFNPHAPARLDKRQLGQEFKNYLDNSVADATRHTSIAFKVLCCDSGTMRLMADPLIRTIRRHNQIQTKMKDAEFKKLKKKNLSLNTEYWLALT